MKLFKGKAVSPGYAIGKIYVYKPFEYTVSSTYFDVADKDLYVNQMKDAFSEAGNELKEIVGNLTAVGDEKAAIFEAHLEILEDEELIDGIWSAIEECATPDYAVDRTYNEYIHMLEKVKDPLVSARAADLRDVRNRLIRILHGEKEKSLSALPENVVVVARDLLPSDTATLDKDKVIGIITEIGSSTSHTAIIARGYGIPAVLGVKRATTAFSDGDFCIVDAMSGSIYQDPDEERLAEYTDKKQQFDKEALDNRSYLAKDASLKDGERIMVGLNIGSTDASADYQYSDFVGLLRTEFLYMHSDHMPTEEEQFEAYKTVLLNAAGRPVTMRTLDIGGDKTLTYMETPKEENPFLGKRALRFCLDNPDMFNTQLRAALRASVYGELWVMFPMIGTMDDIYAAKAALDKARGELRDEGVPYDEHLKVGIMIEIPSIAEIADIVAQQVDFASIGSNDLTQYLLACDRMNAEISDYYQSRSPAMFRCLNRIIKAFDSEEKPISICGEMGGDPASAIVLVGMGLRKLSMAGANLPRIKRVLSKFTSAETTEIALKVLNMKTQAEIDEYLIGEIRAHMNL